MPPTIALLLCILFSLYLFKLDFDRKPEVSYSLWIPMLWVMIIGSRMVSLWLNPLTGFVDSAEAYLEGNPVDRPIFTLLILIGLFILIKRKVLWAELFKRNAWVIIFFAFCAISILWSDYSFVAFKRYIKALGSIIMILIVLTEPAPFEAIKTMIRRCSYVLIPLSIVLIKYYPHLGRLYHRWSGDLTITGVTTNKNSLGILCAICGIVLVVDFFSDSKNRNIFKNKQLIFSQLIIFIMILWLLIKSNSAAALGSFIIGSSALILTGISTIRKNIKLAGFFGLCIILFLQYAFDITGLVISSLGRDSTLTGRTDIWKDAIDMVANSWFGNGFESFWLGNRLEFFWAKYWIKPNEVHNGYLETYLDTGYIGVFLLICVIISSYNSISKELINNDKYGRLLMAFLTMSVAYNIAESGFRPMQLMGFIFFLVAVCRPQTAPVLNQEAESTSPSFLK